MKKIYLLLIAAFVVCSNVFAQEGVIDASFGNRGIATTAYNTVSMNGHTSVLQPDGKIIMASSNATNAVTLVRYKSDGSADISFGINGKAVIAISAGSYLGGTAASLAVQADGKIIYAGNSSESIVLARLKTNGTLDSSFGTAGLSYRGYLPSWFSQVWKVIVKPDGKIITGGTGTYNTNKYFEVVQFLANGNIDASFASNGFYHYTAGNGGGCFSLAMLANGHIMVGGAITARVGTMSVINLLANGHADSTYGINGVATCFKFTANATLFCRLAVQSDNRVLAVGYGGYSGGQAIGVARFKTNGTPDSSFAFEGTLTTTFKNFNDLPQNVYVQADGKILISGSASGKFALMRLKANGTTDTLFARLGKMNTGMPGTGNIFNSFVQPDGKIVLTGISNIGGVYSFVAGRFEQTPQSYYNTLKGTCFLDNNHNGVQDGSEGLMSNVKISVVKNRFDSLSAFASNGVFMLDYLDTGSYVSQPIIESSCFTIPGTHVTTNNTYFNVDSVAFAMQPSPCFRDVAVSLSTCRRGIPRSGHPLVYTLFYRNDGTDIAAGKVEFIKSNKLDFSTSTVAPDSIIGDTMRWNFSGLLPKKSAIIYITVIVKLPPFANLYDVIYSQAIITSDTFEQNLQTNTSFIRQLVHYSWDPNNKIENHGGKITAAEVASGEALTYTINFQNTGNDTAFDVFLHDTLSSKLDWNTLEMVTASSNYQLVMQNGVCKWSFRNINLPDSNVNLEGSQGFVTFRIKPKANVQVGDVISNTAAIYFDYNLPVFTNTENTTVVANSLPLNLLSFTAKKDGKTNQLNWSTANEINVDRFDVERGINGRDFTKIGAVMAKGISQYGFNYTFTDNEPLAGQSNFYRLKMKDKDGKFTYSPVRMIGNNSSYHLSVYPNPAKDNLQIQIDSDMKTALQMQVLSMDGKVILSNSVGASEGSVLRSMNISSLPKGTYILKVISTDKYDQLVKFEKI